MAKRRLYIFDTTLRDGQQSAGVDFSVSDKQEIAALLDALGVDYIEGGYPGANPIDDIFFQQSPKLKKARFTAFGMTKRTGTSASNDPNLAAALDTDAKAVCLVGKSWDFHVKTALQISQQENLANISESMQALGKSKREALLDCEHFFDGYKANPAYALACAKAAYEAGARWVVLCDTNGGTLPEEVKRIIGEVAAHIPLTHLGIHAHNDTENAVANTLAAVDAGVCQVQGTLNGLGERCGNANLMSLLPTLVLKEPYSKSIKCNIGKAQIKTLTHISRRLDDILNRPAPVNAPYVGVAAFAHKGGIHASAVLKEPKTYEHIEPKLVGNDRQVLISDQAGKSNLVGRLKQLGIKLPANDARLGAILRHIKACGLDGVSYDGADASFELLAKRALQQLPQFFSVTNYQVSVAGKPTASVNGDSPNGTSWQSASQAQLQLVIDGESHTSTGEGNGPINALDQALRQDLKRYQRYIKDVRLVDYKVRILNAGTGATTRVLVESADGKGNHWRTLGVSPNVVDASFQALLDSINYKLLRAGAKPKRDK